MRFANLVLVIFLLLVGKGEMVRFNLILKLSTLQNQDFVGFLGNTYNENSKREPEKSLLTWWHNGWWHDYGDWTGFVFKKMKRPKNCLVKWSQISILLWLFLCQSVSHYFVCVKSILQIQISFTLVSNSDYNLSNVLFKNCYVTSFNELNCKIIELWLEFCVRQLIIQMKVSRDMTIAYSRNWSCLILQNISASFSLWNCFITHHSSSMKISRLALSCHTSVQP